jgi:protein phosphatase
MLDIAFGQASDPGKLRSNNEDAMGAFIPRSRQEARSHGWMFVVADGVGGLNLGDVASTKTVAVMAEGFGLAPAGTSLVSLLPRLIQHANAAVHDETLTQERRGSIWLPQSFPALFATTKPTLPMLEIPAAIWFATGRPPS